MYFDIVDLLGSTQDTFHTVFTIIIIPMFI